jgi:hypothetical protein
MVEIHWTKVYTSNDIIKTEILKSGLEDQGIPVRVLNKQDSVYVVIGEIDLMVPIEYAEKAFRFLEGIESENE